MAAKSSTQGAAQSSAEALSKSTAEGTAETVAKSAGNGVLDAFPFERLALSEIGAADPPSIVEGDLIRSMMNYVEGDLIRSVMFIVALSLQGWMTMLYVRRMFAKRSLLSQTPINFDSLTEPLIVDATPVS